MSFRIPKLHLQRITRLLRWTIKGLISIVAPLGTKTSSKRTYAILRLVFFEKSCLPMGVQSWFWKSCLSHLSTFLIDRASKLKKRKGWSPYVFFDGSSADLKNERVMAFKWVSWEGTVSSFVYLWMGVHKSISQNPIYLTAVYVILNSTRVHGHRRVESQWLLNAVLEILELLEVVRSARPIGASENGVDLLNDFLLAFRMMGKRPKRPPHAARGRIVAFEHERVDFLANIFSR